MHEFKIKTFKYHNMITSEETFCQVVTGLRTLNSGIMIYSNNQSDIG